MVAAFTKPPTPQRIERKEKKKNVVATAVVLIEFCSFYLFEIDSF